MKTIWLVLGNKGSVGKSVVHKALVEWLEWHDQSAIVIDGDEQGDIAKTFEKELPTEQFDLSTNTGWAEFADWICQTNYDTHIVTNMPDGVTEKTLSALQRYYPTVEAFGYELRALFVVNTLADGLKLLPHLVKLIRNVYPIKNLFFGQSGDFLHFNKHIERHFSDNTIYFPRLYPRVMNQVRSSDLPYSLAITSDTQTLYTKLELSNWLDRAIESFDEVLLETLNEPGST